MSDGDVACRPGRPFIARKLTVQPSASVGRIERAPPAMSSRADAAAGHALRQGRPAAGPGRALALADHGTGTGSSGSGAGSAGPGKGSSSGTPSGS
jgi:hypothetical protein